VLKYTVSNRLAKEWAKTNSPTGEAFAMLGGIVNGAYARYTVLYPTDNDYYMWTHKVLVGPDDYGTAVSKETFLNDVVIGAFDLPDEHAPELVIGVGKYTMIPLTEAEYELVFPNLKYDHPAFMRLVCGKKTHCISSEYLVPIRYSDLAADGKGAR
jgi:hypothetical protein